MSDDTNEPPDPELASGLRFLHTMGMQTKFEVFEASTRVLALLEELISRGQIDLRSFEERRERIKAQEQERARVSNMVAVAPNVDKYKLTDLPQIDCEARLHLCEGRCCTLMFPLSFQDLDEGTIRWEYGKPYLIKHREDGYCVHNTATRGCGVYEKRPAICRSYDCRKDKRIWIDFEQRIPAPWPNQNNAPPEPEA